MSALQKILVVDDGHRDGDRALSAELAELGYASVTTSLEATDDVLALMPHPAAILLHMPSRSPTQYASFEALAARLRRSAGDVPIIVVHAGAGGYASLTPDLERRIGARVLNQPDR